jgi:hypothetical protein
VSTREVVVYLILSAGLLAMPLGAFGLLAALTADQPGGRRRLALIGLYGAGVLLCAFALALAGHWYLGAPLVLMLIPVDTALRRNGGLEAASRQRG